MQADWSALATSSVAKQETHLSELQHNNKDKHKHVHMLSVHNSHRAPCRRCEARRALPALVLARVRLCCAFRALQASRGVLVWGILARACESGLVSETERAATRHELPQSVQVCWLLEL